MSTFNLTTTKQSCFHTFSWWDSSISFFMWSSSLIRVFWGRQVDGQTLRSLLWQRGHHWLYQSPGRSECDVIHRKASLPTPARPSWSQRAVIGQSRFLKQQLSPLFEVSPSTESGSGGTWGLAGTTRFYWGICFNNENRSVYNMKKNIRISKKMLK